MADLLGPAAFGAARTTTERPTYTPSILNADSWFQDCTSQAARDGTEIRSALLNAFLAQLRTLFRAGEVLENNADDMLLRAIRSQRANLVAAASVGGTANAITLSFTPAFASLSEIVGVPIRFVVEANSTAAVTIAVDGLTAAPLTFVDGTNVAAGGLASGRLIEVMYDGTRFLALAGVTAASGHTHPMADIIGLLAALDGKVAKAGDVMAGLLRLSYSNPEFRLGETGGAWRLTKQGNVGASGPLALQHSTDDFASTPSTIFSVNPSTGRFNFSSNIALGGGIEAGGSLGSANTVLTGGENAQWRTLPEMGFAQIVIPPASLTATDAVWDGLEPGVYSVTWIGLEPNAARFSVHPRSNGVDAQQNLTLDIRLGSTPQSYGVGLGRAIDLLPSDPKTRSIGALPDWNRRLNVMVPNAYVMTMTVEITSAGRMATDALPIFPDRSSVSPPLLPYYAFDGNFPIFQQTGVNGFSIRGASGRGVRVITNDASTATYTTTAAATIHQARLIKLA